MKKWIVAIVICTLLACSTLIITVAALEPSVRLPGKTVDVTLHAEHGNGTDSWFMFNITLTNVPSEYYDVKNGSYNGWCVQKSKDMSLNGTHPVTLWSCYDDNRPNTYKNETMPWNKINYIINNRDGYNRIAVQYAIWHYTDNKNVTNLTAPLVNAAEQNGNFVPQTGQKLAIPIEGTNTNQLAFLELIIPPASLQGLVWYDTNADGIQNEAVVQPGVTVQLYNSSGVFKEQTQTNPNGIYSFGSQKSGVYYLKFILPTDYKFTIKDAGSDDTRDSDADPTTWKTINFTIPANQNETITIWDAGMYKPSSGGTPIPPGEPTVNKRPTADASAGEPYRGFINTNITFNGSRSYDIDGRIITWRWNFGDETNGTGDIIKHKYTLPGNYTVSLLVTDNKFATDIYTTTARITLGNNLPSVPVLSGSLSGHVSVSSQYTVVSTDPDGDNLRYIIDWGDAPKETSPPIASGNILQTTHQWNAAGFYRVQVYAQDSYNANSSISTMTVSIDVHYAQNLGYFIDENSDGIFDKFHNNATGTETAVKQQTNGKYLIDSNGDGALDLMYDTTNGQTEPYSEQPLLWYIIIILVILVIASLLIFYLMKKRKRPQE